MIRNIKFRVTADPRGGISSGMMDGTLPRSLDYFNISAFPELVSAYGTEPKAITLFMPSDEVTDFFDCNYELWRGKKGEKTKGTKIRKCDSVVCVHRIDEKIGTEQYGAGEESKCVCAEMPENDPRRCKYSAFLKAFVAIPQTGKVDNLLCYTFRTHSKNSGDAVYSELEKVRMLTGGRLRGIPFALSVDMVDSSKDAKQKFPIWRLRALVMASQLRASDVPLISESVGVSERSLAVSMDALADVSVETFRGLIEEIKLAKTIKDLTALKQKGELLVKEKRLLLDHFDELVEALKSKYETLQA